LGVGAGKARSPASEKFRKIGKIAAIGVKRVPAGALLGGQHVEEKPNQFRIGKFGAHPPTVAPKS
jgi:hypothetical protein